MKDCQLQVRVSRAEKDSIKRAAAQAGQDVSTWILSRCLSTQKKKFEELIRKLAGAPELSFVLAELNDFLEALPARDFPDAVSTGLPAELDLEISNRVAGMVEYAAWRKNVSAPDWTRNIPPLPRPVFDSELLNLRLHLLLNSPPPFKRRNLFPDASVGDRV